MKRDWRAAASLLALLSGLFFVRESLSLAWEDVGGMRGVIHQRYGLPSPVDCNADLSQDIVVAFEHCAVQHTPVIEVLSLVLAISASLMIWIWLKPFKK